MKRRAPHSHLAFALTLAACGGGASPAVPPPPAPPPESGATDAIGAQAASTAPAQAVEAPPPAVDLQAVPPPPAPDPMPSVKITAPRADQVIPVDRAPSFEVALNVQSWPVAKDGPHVHLILDNEPYLAVYEPKASIALRDVAPGASLGEGQHVLIAFPSRENHVSVKPDRGARPFAAVSFWIGKRGTPTWRPTDPTLVYSRPKGEYAGPEADEVLLDFYLLNAELGEGKFFVHPMITPPLGDPRSITVTAWQPFQLKNLPVGETRVKLELRDPSGVVVPGPWNSTERVITVKRSSAPRSATDPHAGAGH